MALQRRHPSRRDWFLNQDKFLSQTVLKRLIRTVARRKTNALNTGAKTAVKDWFLICVATETGLRVQEIADLSCGDIQDNGELRVVVVRNGKGGKPRLVSVRRQFLDDARDYLAWKRSLGETAGRDDPLFTAGGRRMCKRALQKSFDRSRSQADILQPHGVGIHSLRHTYASFLLKAGKFNLPLVQKQLGHESMKTTEVYAHLFGADMRRAVDRLYDC